MTAAPSRRRGHTKGGLGRSLATSGSRTCTFNTYWAASMFQALPPLPRPTVYCKQKMENVPRAPGMVTDVTLTG